MPALSLVVCVYQQRDLLARLIHESQGCYDDLVVVQMNQKIQVHKLPLAAVV